MISLLSSSFLLAADCNRQLVNGWSGAWEPFILGTYDKPSGLDMEILSAVMDSAGCKWRNTKNIIPWTRHLLLVKAGELDLATGASWTKERSEYAYFSKPYRNDKVAVFVKQSDYIKYAHLSLKELVKTDWKLGVTRGFFYGTEVEELLQEMGDKVEHVNLQSQNTHKLKANRIDGYLDIIPFESIRLKKEGNETVTNCNRLKMEASDGKIYNSKMTLKEMRK